MSREKQRVIIPRPSNLNYIVILKWQDGEEEKQRVIAYTEYQADAELIHKDVTENGDKAYILGLDQ